MPPTDTTTDLIRRLRDAVRGENAPDSLPDVAVEAADLIERLERELAEARKLAKDWRRSARWEDRQECTLTDILRGMRNQYCDELSYADLAADGGLPETQDLHPEIGRLRSRLAEARAERDRATAWADELRDRIRDVYIGTSKQALNQTDVAGEDIASAEKECRLRHEAMLRPSADRAKETDDERDR